MSCMSCLSENQRNLNGEISIVRVLVVEDHIPFGRFISSTLNKKRNLQIICEVSDGLEAIQKAEQLKPDLILLDIGLPTLNGLDVAREIRRRVRESKIIFLTSECDALVVQEAITLGARAYVVKAMAGSDLLTALEAVISGKQFASSTLGDHYFDREASHAPGLPTVAPVPS